MSSIAVLVPVCSRNQNYNNFNEVPFVNFLYPSLLKTIDTKHEYKIFVGVDSTDEFYTNNIGEFYFLGAPSKDGWFGLAAQGPPSATRSCRCPEELVI